MLAGFSVDLRRVSCVFIGRRETWSFGTPMVTWQLRGASEGCNSPTLEIVVSLLCARSLADQNKGALVS